ncbi:MAG: DJ-1/PfpI family protein [Clostridiales bacterium]|nr:DJ-1/PfpI family protein [Clostridiales bacterium]
MVYILLGKGFEEIEAVAPLDILRRGGVEAAFAGIGGMSVEGAHGIVMNCDLNADDIDLDKTDMLVIPGGLGGVESISGCEEVMTKIKNAGEKGIALAAICAGPTVLHRLGLLKGVKAVCYPGMEEEMPGTIFGKAPACVDGKIITGRGPGAALEFGFELLRFFKGDEAVRAMGNSMVCG